MKRALLVLTTALLLLTPHHPVARRALTLPATDNFTRPDSASLGANWTQQVAALQIISHAAHGTSDSNYQPSFWNADVFPNDQFSEITIASFNGGTGSQPGPTVRASGTGGSSQYYLMLCRSDTNQTDLFVYTGSFTLIGSPISTSWANGDVARLEVSGYVFTLKRNGSTIGTITDGGTTIASGSAGFELDNFNDQVTLWNGGAVSAGGTPGCKNGLLLQGAGCLFAEKPELGVR